MDNYKTSRLESEKIVAEFLRYLNFWPWVLLSLIISILSAYTFLRYAQYEYLSSAKIEILDKAQDSEMALPTSMTIFNRSMINLENEIGVLSSFSLNKKVINSLNGNIKYFTVGTIKTSEDHPDEWFDNYNLTMKIGSDEVKNNLVFEIETFDDSFTISQLIGDYIDKKYEFQNFSTYGVDHELPFDISLSSPANETKKRIVIYTLENAVKSYTEKLKIFSEKNNANKSSDQLIVSLRHTNRRISEDYINRLILEFDRDGVQDRQFEYKRTMDFVDSRSSLLKSELEQIEIRKSNFKKDNNLSNLESDATNLIQEQLNYDSELFNAQSQKDLSDILKESVLNKKYDYLPVNIGLESDVINTIIAEHNNLIREREVFLVSAGSNNTSVKNIERQIDNYIKSIVTSIENYQKNIDIKIDNLTSKENELASFYSMVPENEKILRSIERELNVKEALFLLLLQKREEAAINFAVIKPSIKIIDSAISGNFPISPNSRFIYFISALIGFIFPIAIIYLRFLFDNKIHTKAQLAELVNSEIPIVGEIPFLNSKKDSETLISSLSRSSLAESVRMLSSNLKYSLILNKTKKNAQVTLITSSIKGEGKTIISSNLASLLSESQKVLLIGADLRNPQIHKLINTDKDRVGLADLIYKSKFNQYKDYLIKVKNLDILLSGSIPPNPSELLSSDNFEEFINIVKSDYDHIIVDSAPCLLVSDTFEIAKFADLSVYVVRANFSENNLIEFINEVKTQNKLNNVSLVLNSVGNSKSYGYKYGYQYGYKYGYKYGYNYGYGYGYSEDKT